jgi:hypothetical protein
LHLLPSKLGWLQAPTDLSPSTAAPQALGGSARLRILERARRLPPRPKPLKFASIASTFLSHKPFRLLHLHRSTQLCRLASCASVELRLTRSRVDMAKRRRFGTYEPHQLPHRRVRFCVSAALRSREPRPLPRAARERCASVSHLPPINNRESLFSNRQTVSSSGAPKLHITKRQTISNRQNSVIRRACFSAPPFILQNLARNSHSGGTMAISLKTKDRSLLYPELREISSRGISALESSAPRRHATHADQYPKFGCANAPILLAPAQRMVHTGTPRTTAEVTLTHNGNRPIAQFRIAMLLLNHARRRGV